MVFRASRCHYSRVIIVLALASFTFGLVGMGETGEPTGLNDKLLAGTRRGDIEEVTAALQKGAQPNAVDAHGMTPLHWAADQGYPAILRLLLDHGAKPDNRDKEQKTPLHYAAQNGHLRVVQELLEAGADKYAQDKYGHTPWFFAHMFGQVEIAKILKPSRKESSTVG